MNSIPIDYVMRDVTGKYDYPWKNWEGKLKNCLLHTGDSFKNDYITLHSFYSQYIRTKGLGYNIINKYHYTNNGRKCHHYFQLHFRNDSNLTNKATTVTSTMNSAVYNGDSNNFTLETNYTIMLKSFNDLAATGSSRAIKNMKKINSSEQGLNDPQAIHWCIIWNER